jgi:hypothetical protein
MHAWLCTYEAVGLLALMMSFLTFIRYSFKRKESLSLIIFGVVPGESFDFFLAVSVICFFVIGLIIYFIRTYLTLFSWKFFLLSFSALVIFATLSLFFPLFGYAFALLSTASLVFVPLPNYTFLEKIKLVQMNMLFHLCQMLKDSGLLDFFSTLYLVIWCLPTKKFYKLFLSFFVITIFYVLISRYYFLTCVMEHKTFTIYESLLIYISLVIGLLTVYARVMLNMSLITINYTLYHHRELLTPNFLLLTVEQGNPMPDSTPPPIENKSKQFVFFQKNHNNVRNTIPNAATSRRISLFGLFCTVCIGGGTIFYAKKTYDAQMQNNFEMTRQNDAEEVAQGFMTREEYIKKYKKGP